jgi:hypothetical protein
MNVRTITNPIIPVESIKTSETKNVKMEVSAEDREADGRRGQDEPSKNPLSEEEFKKAQEYIEGLTGLKANGLTVEVDEASGLKIFIIKDHEGHVVRRIVEWEMRLILNDKDKKVGQIFDKSA